MVNSMSVILPITGMTCVNCASAICLNVSKLPGVFDVISNALIAISYASILFFLIFFVRKRGGMLFTWMVFLFGLFILVCGSTYLVHIIGPWWPVNWWQATVDGICAIVSVATAVIVWSILPKLLSIPSPNKFRMVNTELQKEKDKLLITQRELQKAYDEIEHRVNERTKDLLMANKLLQEEIHDRKKAEDALRSSEEHFRNIFEHSVIGKAIYKIDDGKRITNDAYRKILGYSEEELALLSWQDLTHPDDLDRDQGLIDSIIKGEISSIQGEKRYIHKDGHIVWGGISIFLQRDDTGKPLYFISSVFDISERKQMENALRESERLLRESQTIARLGSFSWDLFTGLWRSSKILDDIFGLDESYVRSLDGWITIVHPDWRKIMTDYVKQEVLGKQLRFDKEYQIIRPANRELRWVHGQAELEYDGNHQPIKLIGTISDISERKKAEEALRENERRLSLFYDTVGDVLIHLAVENIGVYRFISVNHSFYKITGLSPEMVIGKYVTEVIPEPSLSLILEKYKQAIEEKRIIKWEETSEYPSGVLTGEVSVAPVLDDNGHCTHLVGSVHDISERKKAEIILHDSNERLKVILENNPIAIWDWDLETDVWFVTPKYYTMLGYEPEVEYPERSVWLARIHPDDRESVGIKINKVLNHTGEKYSYDARMLHANGSYRWQSVIGQVTERDENGKAIHMLGVRVDINERKQAEEALQKLNEVLEQRVIERTIQLETSNKELEAFSYSISHDLRAPLRHITGFISLFLKNKTSQFTEEELGYLNIVTSSADEMGKLIDALLTFSRLNKAGFLKTRIDTLQIVQQGLNLYEEEIKSREIEITIAPLHETYGDYQLIGQVWANLISNAIKYTGKKEKPVIEIGSFIEGNETIFYIKDNGAGFKMKYVDKLFNVFQRLHKSNDFEGIGIGLANINRIVTRHGGRCWAEGEVEKGATFYFTIP